MMGAACSSPGSLTRQGFPKTSHTWPGDGDGDVRRIARDLVANDYNGGFSIEPHMGSVHHEPGMNEEEGAYRTYVEYGRRLMKLVEEVSS